MESKIIAFSSPSGGGKTTIIKALLKAYKNTRLSISATTRLPRHNEKDGVDYYFLSKNEFNSKIENGDFLEYENVHGNLYGTLNAEIDKAIKQNQSLIFDVDVKGALNIKKEYQDAILIFIKPPSIEELEKRLKRRETENHETISKRLARMKLEFNEGKNFKYTVINDELEKAILEIEGIIWGDSSSDHPTIQPS